MPRTDYTVTDEQQQAFLAKMKPLAQAAQKRTGVPAPITVAQGILESFWGLGDELDPAMNNLFGQKDLGDDPYRTGTRTFATTEYRADGSTYTEQARFNVYPNWQASVDAHADYVTGRIGSAYTKSIYGTSDRPTDPAAFARWLVTPPRCYATDPKYPARLVELIAKHGLVTLTAEPQPAPASPAEKETRMTIRDTLADIIDRAAAANIGYDQSQRRSWYNDASGQITEGPSEADCSALSAGCWRLAGIPIDGDTHTAVMAEDCCSVGATLIDVSGWTVPQIEARMRCGDFVLGPGHVVIVTRDGLVLSAEGDENGRAYGGKAGDQTGREVLVKRLYARSKGWAWLVQPPHADAASPAPSNATATADTLPEVRRGSVGKAVEAIQRLALKNFSTYAGGIRTHGGADGEFGQETEKWVREFQRRVGFTGGDVDGIVGRRTWAMLIRHGLDPRDAGSGVASL